MNYMEKKGVESPQLFLFNLFVRDGGTNIIADWSVMRTEHLVNNNTHTNGE